MISRLAGIALVAGLAFVFVGPLAAASPVIYAYQGGSCNWSQTGVINFSMNTFSNYNCSDNDNFNAYACDQDTTQVPIAAGVGVNGDGSAHSSAGVENNCGTQG